MLTGLIDSFFHTVPITPSLKHILQAIVRTPLGGIANLCLTCVLIAGSGFLSLLAVAGIFDISSWRDGRHVRNTVFQALGAAASVGALVLCQAFLPAIPLTSI
ncbi:MAG: hypothetical protein PW791_11445 [Neorhizobium sp.]|jgi:hypothetical protein|nr:hypothetical protein [Neorhizobium sp.]